MAQAEASLHKRRAYRADLLHITLFMLYTGRSLPPALVARAARGAEMVSASSFDLEFDRIGLFGAGRHIALTGGANPELAGLCARIANAFGRVSLAHQMVASRPHVTLIYDRRAVAPWVLSQPIRWTVRDFRLIWSEFGARRHDELGRWTLSGTPPAMPGQGEFDFGETPVR